MFWTEKIKELNGVPSLDLFLKSGCLGDNPCNIMGVGV